MEKYFELVAIGVTDFDTIIIVFYQVPTENVTDIDLSFDKLEECLLQLSQTGKSIILSGDHNVDTLANTNKSMKFKIYLGHLLCTLV